MENIVYKVDESLYKEAKAYLPEKWMSLLFPTGYDCIIDESVITSKSDIKSILDDTEDMYSDKQHRLVRLMLNTTVVIVATGLCIAGIISVLEVFLILTMSVLAEITGLYIKRSKLEKNKYANFIVLKLHDLVITTASVHIFESSMKEQTIKLNHVTDEYKRLRKTYMEFFEKVATENINLANRHISELKSADNLDIPVTIVYSETIH